MGAELHAARTPRAATLYDFLPREAGALTGSFARYLRSENKAERTVEKYLASVASLAAFLDTLGEQPDVAQITKRHIQEYIVHVLERSKSSTANTRFFALKVFFSYLLEDDEIRWHPMEGMSAPPAPAPVVPVLADDTVAKLLKACSGASFEDRRDTALIMLFCDTGARLSELANLAVTDLGEGGAQVMGKGSKPRVIHFGNATARALDKYLRARDRHTHADLPNLWLGRRGATTRWGIRDAIDRRAEMAGLAHIHPHQFRHTFAHTWLAEGGQENDLMRLAGWSSRTMLGRYAASAADARAAENYKRRQSPVDKLKGGAK